MNSAQTPNFKEPDRSEYQQVQANDHNLLEKDMQISPYERPEYDLVCAGFGPASLAIAIAIRDRGIPARVLFLERNSSFLWHPGMLMPGARMQISFMKDLATLRNPKSEFTFINYLHRKGRLSTFTNLGTFLPLREEYNDYMSWCASHFDRDVKYGMEVLRVFPMATSQKTATGWRVMSRDVISGKNLYVHTKNVVIAIGGRPGLPPEIEKCLCDPRVIHSSQYSQTIPMLLRDKSNPYNIAVVGAGQSSAEIFNDLHSRYPKSTTSLFIRQRSLKPSDDSPFVNEIFDPDKVDEVYSLPPEIRKATIAEDRATNYSVVRIELLEELYQTLYRQKLHNPNGKQWPHQIHPHREIIGVKTGNLGGVHLRLQNTQTKEIFQSETSFDVVIFGTGYIRDVHHSILKPVEYLMEGGSCTVGRDYAVKFKEEFVAKDANIYLQGCCEDTHGVSPPISSR
jgi:L-ornithine N5-oxygenase